MSDQLRALPDAPAVEIAPRRTFTPRTREDILLPFTERERLLVLAMRSIISEFYPTGDRVVSKALTILQQVTGLDYDDPAWNR